MNGERDVFIAHAHQDKAEFVRPLVSALSQLGVSCWLDEGSIGPGDSFVAAINEGLRGARYVLVVITQRFLAAPWAPKELNAALHLEARRGDTIVIPILAVDQAALDPYPLLLDKRWLEWSRGPQYVAAQVAELFHREPAADWAVDFPQHYQGVVWARVVPGIGAAAATRSITFRWGPHIRRVELSTEDAPQSLTFHKINADSVTLHVQVEPSTLLTFGYGPAPDEHPKSIDEGWQRAAGWTFPAESAAQGEPTGVRAGIDEAKGTRAGRARPALSRAGRALRRAAIGRGLQSLRRRCQTPVCATVGARRSCAPEGSAWDPATARISIYAGPRLTSQQRSLGMGWGKAIEFGENVTDQILEEAR